MPDAHMIPPAVIEWLFQYARPSAIRELWEQFADPIGGEQTPFDIVAAAQLAALHLAIHGTLIEE